MATEIVAITQSGGIDYQHITKLWWLDGGTKKWMSREMAVSFIEQGGQLYTERYGNRAYCEVVDPYNGSKYVRTRPDSITGNNLLSLPRW